MPYPPTSEPLSPSTPVTSSIVPPITVPTHGPGGTFSVIANTHVSAPPLVTMNLIRNTTTWPSWNTFCPGSSFSKSSKPDLSNPKSDDIPRGNENWMEKGSVLIIDVFMNGDGLVEGGVRSRKQEIHCTLLEKIEDEGEGKKGYRIAWKSAGWSHWQLHSERVMEFIEVDVDGKIETDYSCWETFGGMMGSTVKFTVGSQLIDRFGDYARDVKEFLEKGEKTSESVGVEQGVSSVANGVASKELPN